MGKNSVAILQARKRSPPFFETTLALCAGTTLSGFLSCAAGRAASDFGDPLANLLLFPVALPVFVGCAALGTCTGAYISIKLLRRTYCERLNSAIKVYNNRLTNPDISLTQEEQHLLNR